MKFVCSSGLVALFCLFSAAFGRGNSDACLDCSTKTCALVPSSNSTVNPFCYEGALEDANDCFNNDPLLPKDQVAQCGTCAGFGFTEYKRYNLILVFAFLSFRNDPIYREMGLWALP